MGYFLPFALDELPEIAIIGGKEYQNVELVPFGRLRAGSERSRMDAKSKKSSAGGGLSYFDL